MRFVPRMSLPLLRKEMVETAARKRTYSMRFIYALALFTVWCLVLWQVYRDAGGDPDRITGQGRYLFDTVMWVQLAGLYLFLPAMVAGAITSERENKTMTLLIITDLRPWEILVQKMLGRMLPVLTFLFLAMPLAAMAYVFGGVETKQVSICLYVLVVTAVQVAAAAVFVSTFCKSTVSALLVCYLVGPLIYLMAIIGNVVVGVLWMGVVYVGRAALGGGAGFETELLLNAFPPALLFEWETQSLLATVINTVPAWLVSGLFILMARDELVAGTLAMGPQAPVNMQFTQTKSIPDAYKREPPTDQPVAWRMGAQGVGSAGTVRVVVAATLTLVLGFFAMALTTGEIAAAAGLLTFMGVVAWLVFSLVIGVLGSGAVAPERAHGTLDVLLTTPITGVDLIDQKMQSVQRWRSAAVLILGIVAGLKALCLLAAAASSKRVGIDTAAMYAVVAALGILIYPALLTWYAVWVGLTVRTHAKSSMMTLASSAAFCVGLAVIPAFVCDLITGDAPRWLPLLSPGAVVVYNEGALEGGWFGHLGAAVVLTVQFLAYGYAAVWLRRHCRLHADEYLGRIPVGDGPAESDPAPAPAPAHAPVAAPADPAADEGR